MMLDILSSVTEDKMVSSYNINSNMTSSKQKQDETKADTILLWLAHLVLIFQACY